MTPRPTHLLFAALALAALGLAVAALRYMPSAGVAGAGAPAAVAGAAAPSPGGGLIGLGLRRALPALSDTPEAPAAAAESNAPALPQLRGTTQTAALTPPEAPAEESIAGAVSFPPVAPTPPARPNEMRTGETPLPPVRPRELAAIAPSQPAEPTAASQAPAQPAQPAPATNSGWSAFQWPQTVQPGTPQTAAAPQGAATPVYADVPRPPSRPAGLDRLASLSPPEAPAQAAQPAQGGAEGTQVAKLEEPTLRPAPDDAFQPPPPKFGMGDPVFVRIFKQEGQLELWLKKNGRYALYKTFPICKWSGRLGPKLKEADYQSPEGFYSVSAKQLNPHSNYYRAFNVGYPNAFDRQNGRTGGLVMVHGACKSVGCFAMTDRGIEEIYGFVEAALRAGQKEIPVHIFPFRMTDANLARETGTGGGWLAFVSGGGGYTQWSDFWRNLKQGYDHFEQTGEPPVAFACGDHYEFDGGSSACRRVAGW